MSEATKKAKDQKINGKSTNATNRTSHVWPTDFILFTTVTKTWRAFMSAFLHGQPSLRAIFFRLQVVLHEQDCKQIKTVGQWPVFELQSTKNIFEYSLKNIRKTNHLTFTSFTTCRAIIFVLFAFISPKWKPYAFTEPSLGSKLRISPKISVSVSISSPKSEAMNWSNNGCSGQWPRLTNKQCAKHHGKWQWVFNHA